jgi:putative flavoprotein involved in K+ transport
MPSKQIDTLVIGAGQAGQAAAYYLQQHGVDFVVLDERAAVGEVWATRFEALHLFSPAWASGLPGFPWPGPALRYPTKDEAAAYLQAYAAHFRFPVQLGERAVRLTAASTGSGYYIETKTGTTYQARRVIICTGAYSAPKQPAFATSLPPQVQQLHSSQYHQPSQILGIGPVAVVGSGNSALQIAADLATTGRPVFVAFDDTTGAFPNNQLTWVLLKKSGFLHVPRATRLGRHIMRQPEPVVRGDLQRLKQFPNAHFIGRATGATATGVLQGQRQPTPILEAVVWATGFGPGFQWIELPIFEPDGTPHHERGLTAAPGIAFLGLPWLSCRSSALMGGAGPDARYVVEQLLKST